MEEQEYFIQGPVENEGIFKILAALSNQMDAGAQSMFIGRVRADHKSGGKVTGIEYSLYEPMANQVMREIIEGINRQYQLSECIVMHSKGWVRTGEISLFILCSAVHRRDAIDACNLLVEEIKFKLPVWGKEIMDSGSEEWKINHK